MIDRSQWEEEELKRYIDALEIEAGTAPVPVSPANAARNLSKRIFIVHRHHGELKDATARLLERLELEPVILHEQPDGGRTIIEKLSAYAEEAGFALVLLTADDVGAAGTITTHSDLQPRARQNVVFELGFFFGSLGRGRVCAIYESGVVSAGLGRISLCAV